MRSIIIILIRLINLSSLRIVERLIFSKVSFNLLKAPKLETVMKLDANELYSNKPIQLQLNNLMECDTFSVMSSKGTWLAKSNLLISITSNH
jgi:hypothetical protein